LFVWDSPVSAIKKKLKLKFKDEDAVHIVRDVRDSVIESCKKLAQCMSQPEIPVVMKLLASGHQQLSKVEALLMTSNRRSDAKDATIADLRTRRNMIQTEQGTAKHNQEPLMVTQETNTELQIHELWIADVNMF
jgi:hypothetical protein